MQTKSSYRVLKWTFLVGTFVSLGACVVTTGDGGDDDFSDGGESGSSTTAGKTSTAGSTSTAGKTSTAGTGGSGGTSTTTPSAGAGGDGGAAYVPGLCQSDDPTPTSLPVCDLNDDDKNDDSFACRACLKSKCCDSWKTCFGDTPTTACGSGPTEEADGQFECIRNCYLDDMSGNDAEVVLGECEGKCLGQCEAKDTDGFALNDTQDLLGCGQEKCLAECFTP